MPQPGFGKVLLGSLAAMVAGPIAFFIISSVRSGSGVGPGVSSGVLFSLMVYVGFGLVFTLPALILIALPGYYFLRSKDKTSALHLAALGFVSGMIALVFYLVAFGRADVFWGNEGHLKQALLVLLAALEMGGIPGVFSGLAFSVVLRAGHGLQKRE